LVAPAGDHQAGDAIGLLGRDQAELAYSPHVVALNVVDAGVEEFCDVNHGRTSVGPGGPAYAPKAGFGG
jgi:hypothetical protein